jgi:hypothetical protein
LRDEGVNPDVNLQGEDIDPYVNESGDEGMNPDVNVLGAGVSPDVNKLELEPSHIPRSLT